MGFIDQLARTKLSIVVILVAALTLIRIALHRQIINTPPHLRTLGGSKWVMGINEFLDAVIYAGVFVFLVIRPFVLQTFYIPSGSMVPTLKVHDLIVANKFVYRFGDPKVGDIVVFKPPKEALQPGAAETDFIKRVIGVPGDVIEVKNKIVYRNGKPQEEAWRYYTNAKSYEEFEIMTKEETQQLIQSDYKLVRLNDKYYPVQMQGGYYDHMSIAPGVAVTDPLLQAELVKAPPAAIPPGYYLMMGDNRNNSSDGRFWGLVPRESVVGRAEAVLFPIRNAGRTK